MFANTTRNVYKHNKKYLQTLQEMFTSLQTVQEIITNISRNVYKH